jgi:anti-anti-sigma factor
MVPSPQSSSFRVFDDAVNNLAQDLMHWFEETTAQELILDLQSLRQVNNQLLVSLANAYKIAESSGKTLRLSSVSIELKMVLEISRLDQIFNHLGA